MSKKSLHISRKWTVGVFVVALIVMLSLPPLRAGTIQASTTTVQTGGTVTLTATTLGLNDNVQWNHGGGILSSTTGKTVTFTAGNVAGSYTVSAVNTTNAADIFAPIVINVTAAPVALTPASTNVTMGGTVQIATTPSTNANFSITEVNGGTFTGNSQGVTSVTYNAPNTAGTYHVVATIAGGATATSTITVTGSVSINPATLTLGLNSAGTTLATVPVTNVNWSITEANGGTFNTNLNTVNNASSVQYSSPNTAGTYHVLAKDVNSGATLATSTITVSSVAFAINPSNITLSPGQSYQFATTPADGTIAWTVQTANGGTIAANGVYTAPNNMNVTTIQIQATRNNVQTATATVTLSQTGGMTITPTTLNIVAGKSYTFTAIPSTNVVWSVSPANMGTIGFNTGVFTAGTILGPVQVTATSNAGSATATVTIVPFAVNPTNPSVASGGQVSFTADPSDGVVWSLLNGGGTITQAGIFTAGNTAGSFTVKATRGTDIVTVTVNVTKLTINPQSSTLAPGATQQFTANPPDNVTWRVASGPGTISSTGLLTVNVDATGSIQISATSAAGTANATVTIQQLSVTPTVLTIAMGDVQQFTPTPNTGVTWSTTDPTGNVDTNGRYTAGNTPGDYTITASSPAGSVTINVTVLQMLIGPLQVTLQAGGTQQFTTNIKGAVAWTTTGTGNNISASGNFTAGTTIGTYTVTVTSGTKTANATVRVVQNGNGLTISPGLTSVNVGTTVQFSSTPNTGVTWTADAGGTVDNVGLYTAGTTPGVYYVTVTLTNGNGTAQAVVIITPTGGLMISPATATVAYGMSQAFTATPSANVTWTVSGGGSINGGGIFTAGNVSGTFTITATSPAGTSTATVKVTSTGGIANIPGLDEAPDAYWMLTNSVARLGIGHSGTDTTGTAVDSTGSWCFGTTGGDPKYSQDDHATIINKFLAYLYVPGSTGEFQVGLGGVTSSQLPPDVTKQTADMTWNTGDATNSFDVKIHLSLIRDVVHYSYTIINKSPSSRFVGFRTVNNVKFLGKNVANATYIIPTKRAFNDVRDFSGTDVPDEWDIRYTPDNVNPAEIDNKPLMSTVQRLTVGTNDAPRTVPTRLVFAPLDSLQRYNWVNALNPGTFPIVESGTALLDSTGTPSFAVGNYYNNGNGNFTTLAPGAQWVIDGDFSLNWARVAYKDHYAVAIAGDESLKAVNGVYSPAKANLRVYLTNSQNGAGLVRVNATITPSKGLRVDDNENLSYSVQVPEMQDRLLQLNANEMVSWKLVPTGDASGLIPVTVTANFTPGGSITSTFFVNVPAIETSNYSRGIYLSSFPYTFANADPRVALGLGPNVNLAQFDPTITSGNPYRLAVNGDVTLNAGEGYWQKFDSTTSVTLRDATKLDQTLTYPISIRQGWNLIGNPFLYGIEWGKCKVVVDGADVSYTVEEAIANGVISGNIWSWDSTNPTNPGYQNAANLWPWENPAAGTITAEQGIRVPLQPYQGYWLYANQAATLVFVPNQFVPLAYRSMPASTRIRGSANEWKINMKAIIPGAQDSSTFGVTSRNVTTREILNAMKPPVSPTGLSSYFVGSTSTRADNRLGTDMRTPSPINSWTYNVYCSQTNVPVQVSWPDMTQFPAGASLMITDVSTGKRTYMRTASSYTFDSGNGGIRQFVITAGGTIPRLQFTQNTATVNNKRAGATITCAVSIPATVTVTIKTIAGKVVRQLSADAADSKAITINWDGKDMHGNSIRAGEYLIDVLAETADLQRLHSIPMRTN